MVKSVAERKTVSPEDIIRLMLNGFCEVRGVVYCHLKTSLCAIKHPDGVLYLEFQVKPACMTVRSVSSIILGECRTLWGEREQVMHYSIDCHVAKAFHLILPVKFMHGM